VLRGRTTLSSHKKLGADEEEKGYNRFMGIIFLYDPENPDQHPDHKPIPSPASEVITPIGVTALAAFAGVLPLCPAIHEGHDHLHHEIYPGSELPAWALMASGQNSISGVPNGWMDRSLPYAARGVIRFRRPAEVPESATEIEIVEPIVLKLS
jgi:hypothetical protein